MTPRREAWPLVDAKVVPQVARVFDADRKQVGMTVNQRCTVLHDWQRGERLVEEVLRPEDLGRFVDGAHLNGSSAGRCALYGGRKTPIEE